jgi:hypothetical protein
LLSIRKFPKILIKILLRIGILKNILEIDLGRLIIIVFELETFLYSFKKKSKDTGSVSEIL